MILQSGSPTSTPPPYPSLRKGSREPVSNWLTRTRVQGHEVGAFPKTGPADYRRKTLQPKAHSSLSTPTKKL